MFWLKLFKKFRKKKKKKKARRPPSSLPIVRRQLSAGGGFLTNIIGATAPGSKKLQFPFEKLPELDVNVTLEKTTQATLLGLGGLVAGGIVVSQLIKNRRK